ncbi:TonB-dependent Receptor Plug Domain protein [compost metagenome]
MHRSGQTNDFVANAGLLKDEGPTFSGSAVTVNGSELRKVNSINLFDALKYYVPSLIVTQSNLTGSDPNALPAVTLRGANGFPYNAITANNNSGVLNVSSTGDYLAASVTSTGAPVVLLDGIQVSLQTAIDIDLNSVQRVTVLKDATATASYGMRGANGVIAIETLKPKEGLTISFTEQLQLATPDVSSYKSLGAKEKIELENNSGLYNNNNLSAIFQKRYNQAYIDGVNTDWLSIPLQNGVGAKHTLALSSTTEDVVYGLTASYNDMQGSMKGSYRKNLDLGAYFGGHFGSFSFNNQFNYLGSNSSNSTYGSLNNYAQMNPYWSPYDKFTGKFQKFVEIDTINSDGTNRYVNYVNPAYNATLSTTDAAKYVRYSNTLNLNWVLGSGFQLNGIAGISKQSDELNYFLPPNHTTFSNVTPDNLLSRGYYRYTSNSFMDVQGGARLQYERKFDRHELFTNIGQTVIQNSSESEAIAVSGFAVDRLADISFGSAYATKRPVSA